jgi:hypothetical protein
MRLVSSSVHYKVMSSGFMVVCALPPGKTSTAPKHVFSPTPSLLQAHTPGDLSMSPPTSDSFSVQSIENAGRGVISSQITRANTAILTTQGPSAYVIFRQYRKEVCAYCFHYDRGRALPIRETSIGKVFCWKECLEAWTQHEGKVGVEAWRALHTMLQAKRKRYGDEDYVMDASPKPTTDHIDNAWASVCSSSQGSNSAKKSKRALPGQADPDILGYLLSGILCHYSRSEHWQNVLELAMDTTPYKSSEDLSAYTMAFTQLLAILPVELQASCTPSICQSLLKASSHNAFGIRAGGEDGAGEEYMGYALYPDASYFNHSCEPNLAKRRQGRQWNFWAAREIAEGEECCISYLGGDEKALDVYERRARLREVWGFECSCVRCVREAAR